MCHRLAPSHHDLATIFWTVGYQETIWLPTAIYEGSLTDTLIESSFEMPMGMQPWAVGTPPPLSSANCTGCASYTDIRKVEVTQPYETFKDYQFYPFDDHVVAITLTLRGGVVINCPSVLTTHFESAAGTSAEDSWMSILFPQAASSWYLQVRGGLLRASEGLQGPRVALGWL